MFHESKLVFDYADIQKIMIEHVKSMGLTPKRSFIGFKHNPKEWNDRKLLIEVAIEAEPKLQ